MQVWLLLSVHEEVCELATRLLLLPDRQLLAHVLRLGELGAVRL